MMMRKVVMLILIVLSLLFCRLLTMRSLSECAIGLMHHRCLPFDAIVKNI